MVRRTKFDFRRALPSLGGGCGRTKHCTSEGAHYEKCPKLAVDLEKFKAGRKAFYRT